MQHPTAHHPITADGLSLQEQLLIRLDEIVGLLDSIDSRLERWEGQADGVQCQVSSALDSTTPKTVDQSPGAVVEPSR